MNRRYVLLHSSEIQPWREDLQAITAHLAVLAEHGAECEFQDTAQMIEEEMAYWRNQVMACAVWQRLAVRQVFGSRRQGMLPYLGRQIPVLLVYEDGKQIPAAVYPHRLRRGRTSRDYS